MAAILRSADAKARGGKASDTLGEWAAKERTDVQPMKTMKRTIKAGVVGCGYWGPNLVRNLRQSAECQLKIICDTSEARLSHMRRLHPDVATTDDYDAMLRDADLDAVVIREPGRVHSE